VFPVRKSEAVLEKQKCTPVPVRAIVRLRRYPRGVMQVCPKRENSKKKEEEKYKTTISQNPFGRDSQKSREQKR
jgi:hypothetical protein